MLRFQIFQVFFSKIYFFYCFGPYTAQVRNMRSAKNHFLVLFYSAKSSSDHFTISELSSYFSKNQFFSLFRFLYCKVKKQEVRKKITFQSFFIVQNPLQTILRFQNIFNVFFQSINFFHGFEAYTAKVKNMRSEKNHFYCSFIVQNPIQTVLRFQIFHVFFRKFNCFTVSAPILHTWETWGQQKSL